MTPDARKMKKEVPEFPFALQCPKPDKVESNNTATKWEYLTSNATGGSKLAIGHLGSTSSFSMGK
jgi:hypothetical protein